MKLATIALVPLTLSLSMPAAEWTWEWTPAAGEGPVKAEICPLKYGKTWAYAIEIDDGPKWVRSFAVPFFATYRYTDAPPGVAGGAPRPFVGSVAAVASAIGANDAAVDGGDFAALAAVGWGVMNHSMYHDGRSWGDEGGRLDDRRVREDAFWSQVLIAAAMPGGRAPTGAVYANGYTDYNRNDALRSVGIGIATRVGASGIRDTGSPRVAWLDFPRSYLDESAWTNEWSKGAVMADFPGAAGEGPGPRSLVVDFTHDIAREADSANQKRWRERLETIEKRWGISGTDTLWGAPTAEVADYVRAAAAATVQVSRGKVTVRLPDGIPGSALTVRLSGLGPKAVAKPPKDGVLHRQGAEAWVTGPLLGTAGTAPPAVRCVYDGKAGSIDLPAGTTVAGVWLRYAGELPAGFAYPLALRTASGEKQLPGRPLRAGWFAGSEVRALLPDEPAVTATGIIAGTHPRVTGMRVWAVDDGKTSVPATRR